MRNTLFPSPAPGAAPASRRGVAAGRWIVAGPLHLVLAIGLVAGCASSTASTDPAPGPVPGIHPAAVLWCERAAGEARHKASTRWKHGSPAQGRG